MSDELTLDPARCALLVQDLQNDVMIDGGAFAESGSPQHAKDQNVVANVADLAAACRAKGVPVIHVWYIVEPGAPGLKLNAPLFEGVKDAERSCAGPGVPRRPPGSSRRTAISIVEKMRMSAWQGTRLENLLAGLGRDTVIVIGSLDEHVDRAHGSHGGRQGLRHGRPRGRLLDNECRLAQRVDQLRAAERLDGDELRGGEGRDRRLA